VDALKTDLCGVLGIELPIIQAPVGSASCPALTAAVSNAGGLGMLALSWTGESAVRRAIRETRDLTDRPFGVNLVLEWDQRGRLATCLEEGARIVSFFWGDPTPYVKTVHEAGGLVLHTVGGTSEAVAATEAGADVIVAQGWEAGGHVRDTVASMPLVPRVVDAVAPVPVVAAGGIGDGRGLVAALALGAVGAWIGTRFLLAEEAATHDVYRAAVSEADEAGTVYSSLFDSGWPSAPHRTLRNSTVGAWEEAGRSPAGQRPGEGEVVATGPDGQPVERYEDTIPLPGSSGSVEALAMYAGQSVGLADHVRPAGSIVGEIAHEAAGTLGRLGAAARPQEER
jgi:nitronate monooxygenase